MNRDHTLEQLAREAFEAEWLRTMARDSRPHHHESLEDADIAMAVSTQQCCVSTWLLRDLLTLVQSSPDRPVAEMADEIRKHIVDRSFIDECGDPAAALDREATLEQQVEVIIRSLEQVRREAIARGLWSRMSLGPEMFG